jgi:hypothetical protein
LENHLPFAFRFLSLNMKGNSQSKRCDISLSFSTNSLDTQHTGRIQGMMVLAEGRGRTSFPSEFLHLQDVTCMLWFL